MHSTHVVTPGRAYGRKNVAPKLFMIETPSKEKKLYYAFVDLEEAFDRRRCPKGGGEMHFEEGWFASRVSAESTIVCCCHGCCLQ